MVFCIIVLVQLHRDVPLNCPKCGARLVFVRTDGDTNFYDCFKDGVVILPPHGRLLVRSTRRTGGESDGPTLKRARTSKLTH
jgi:hypothetical protein